MPDILNASLALSLLSDAKDAVVWTKSYLWPDVKEINRQLKITELHIILVAKKALKESIIKNFFGKRGPLGLPEACLQEARDFALAAGQEELEKIIEIYNRARDAHHTR